MEGKKYEDLNKNHAPDPGEPYLNDWLIRIYKWNPSGGGWQNIDNRMTGHTGVQGEYTLVDLAQGLYKVCEVLQPGWTQAEPTGVVNNIASDEAPSCMGFEITTSGQEFNDLNFGNIQYGSVALGKWYDIDGDGTAEDWDGSEPMLSGWTLFLDKNGNGSLDPGEMSGVTNQDGMVYFNNNVLPGPYGLCEVPQIGWQSTEPLGTNCKNINLEPGGGIVYYFGNRGIGTIRGVKWDDKNTNGEKDEEGGLLSGWTINLYGQNDTGGYDFIDSKVTDNGGHFGWYWFEFLTPGNYKVCEELKDGWEQTYPGEDGCHDVSLPDGNSGGLEVQENATEGPSYNFGNYEKIFGVSIDKSNDKSGGASAGDTVNYTLVVKNNGNQTIYGMDVIDALPGGLTYVTGSTTGDTTADPIITGNNLTWNDIGDLDGGESITIHYQVKIAGDVTAGTYKNFATCGGDVRSKQETIECNVDDSDVPIGQGTSFGGNLGQVLGISTELPATGSSTMLLIFALGMLGVGLFAKGYNGKKHHAKN